MGWSWQTQKSLVSIEATSVAANYWVLLVLLVLLGKLNNGIYGINHLSTGAGFLPSADRKSQVYGKMFSLTANCFGRFCKWCYHFRTLQSEANVYALKKKWMTKLPNDPLDSRFSLKMGPTFSHRFSHLWFADSRRLSTVLPNWS